MASNLHFVLVLLFLLSKHVFTFPRSTLPYRYNSRRIIRYEWPEITEAYNMTDHLNFDHIKRVCTSRYSICKCDATNICAMRQLEGENQYRDYANSCYLFLSNMCENPGHEYHIIYSGTCSQYHDINDQYSDNESRRKGETKEKVEPKDSKNKPQKLNAKPDAQKAVTKKADAKKADVKKPDAKKADDKKPAAPATKAQAANATTATKKKKKTKRSTKYFSTLYSIDTAFDDHICPMACPKLYSPVCVSANRGFGQYFKFFTFVNHCLGDQYYCQHWKEFAPPPDEDEMVTSSPLSWSFCGASRYLAFARFAEVTSSMGHYGWLSGDYKATHIMEPHERLPGFG